MSDVSSLSTFILASLRDEDSGRVALYHYLKNFRTPDEAVTPQLINEFFAECLQLPHWQQNKNALHSDVQELLQRFFTATAAPFRLDLVWNLPRLQCLNVENSDNLSQVVYHAELPLVKDGEELRLIVEAAGATAGPGGGSGAAPRILVLKRLPTGGVVARSYGNVARVAGNQLIPLGPDQELFYDPSLELVKGQTQKIKTASHGQVRFTIGTNAPFEITAQFISGFAFRQAQALTVPNIAYEPRIFYPLKRLERFFVHRPSDPYYMEITGSLDRALRLLHARSEGAQEFALQAFDAAQIAFDQVFPDDRPLYARLKELAKYVQVHAGSRMITAAERSIATHAAHGRPQEIEL